MQAKFCSDGINTNRHSNEYKTTHKRTLDQKEHYCCSANGALLPFCNYRHRPGRTRNRTMGRKPWSFCRGSRGKYRECRKSGSRLRHGPCARKTSKRDLRVGEKCEHSSSPTQASQSACPAPRHEHPASFPWIGSSCGQGRRFPDRQPRRPVHQAARNGQRRPRHAGQAGLSRQRPTAQRFSEENRNG